MCVFVKKKKKNLTCHNLNIFCNHSCMHKQERNTKDQRTVGHGENAECGPEITVEDEEVAKLFPYCLLALRLK